MTHYTQRFLLICTKVFSQREHQMAEERRTGNIFSVVILYCKAGFNKLQIIEIMQSILLTLTAVNLEISNKGLAKSPF